MADKTKVFPLVPALSAQDRAVKLPELIQLTGKSKTSIYREIKASPFRLDFILVSAPVHGHYRLLMFGWNNANRGQCNDV